MIIELTDNYCDIRSVLKTECTQFLVDSCAIPLLRSLPQEYNNFQKVKARKSKHKSFISTVFDKAFQYDQLLERAVFAYTQVQYTQDDLEPFYIFPVNGYKFIYCTRIQNSKLDHYDTVNTLIETVQFADEAYDIMAEIFKLSYSSDNLLQGLQSDAEILFYDIPYYYAVRTSKYNYNKLIEDLI